jgi:hypothetical protein
VNSAPEADEDSEDAYQQQPEEDGKV